LFWGANNLKLLMFGPKIEIAVDPDSGLAASGAKPAVLGMSGVGLLWASVGIIEVRQNLAVLSFLLVESVEDRHVHQHQAAAYRLDFPDAVQGGGVSIVQSFGHRLATLDEDLDGIRRACTTIGGSHDAAGMQLRELPRPLPPLRMSVDVRIEKQDMSRPDFSCPLDCPIVDHQNPRGADIQIADRHSRLVTAHVPAELQHERTDAWTFQVPSRGPANQKIEFSVCHNAKGVWAAVLRKNGGP